MRAIGDADADDNIRVVALTGNGDAFCSGLDLGGGDDTPVETGLSDQEQTLDEKGWVGRFLVALRFETDKPVVAGINGAAVGAGLSLAMAADIRLAADTARLHPGYLRSGTSPDGGLTWSLPTLVGHEAAMRFLLESRFVDAEDAFRRGLVSEVVPSDQLQARLLELCEAIAAQAPLAVRRTKRLVARTPLVTDVDARVTDEIRSALAGLASEDGQEAVQAIIEKRGPEFAGADAMDRAEEQQAAIDEFLELLQHERRGDEWVGRTPDWFGPVVFGGIGLALTISAACGDGPTDGRLHSLHAHFLRPVLGGREIVFGREVVKAGRAFNLHRVTASQDEKPVIVMTCSFTADTGGYEYNVSGIPDDVPLPEDLPEPADDPDFVGPWTRVGSGPPPRDPTARGSRRTATGSGCREHSTTTRASTARCSATRPIGPESVDGPSTWRVTPQAWSASITRRGSIDPPGSTSGSSRTCRR